MCRKMPDVAVRAIEHRPFLLVWLLLLLLCFLVSSLCELTVVVVMN